MRKGKLILGLSVLLSGSVMFSSCIGSFALTNKVYDWNNSVGDKFVNELVFLVANIIPVYSATVFIDAVVLNSIEFWTDSNPIACNVKEVKGENGNYVVETNKKGYVITNEKTKEVVKLNFNESEKSWSVESNGQSVTFMTFVDKDHVKMYNPNGEATVVELSKAGVMAYQEIINNNMAFACK